MTQLEFAKKYSEEELKEIANEYSNEIVIRSYVDGCSFDDRRKTTLSEKKIIYKILYAAMISYGYRNEENGGSIDAVLDMAEFTLMQFLPEANSYDTVYIPLRKITKTWQGRLYV